MTEENIIINSGRIRLEGIIKIQQGDRGVVVTHPHPLYGGNMHNNVVEAICNAYQEKGYSTLRFNFRGVGQSEGGYEEGIGEQDDVRAAIDYISGLGKEEIDLAGYSFGSWVNALGINRYEKVKRAIMISPPVDLMDFSCLIDNPKIRLVITGSEDDIADYRSVEDKISSWNREAIFKVIKGADHFYWGSTADLQKTIAEFLEQE
jgi:alpha/beta superfamily hydrolase